MQHHFREGAEQMTIKFSISVVSHNSGELLRGLLKDLESHPPTESELIITINTPENEDYLEILPPVPTIIIRNKKPLGFGSNHNQAFNHSSGTVFIIVNPDIRIKNNPWIYLQNIAPSNFGAYAPLVLSPKGTFEDSVRRYPTVTRLLKRVFLGRRSADYSVDSNSTPQNVEWAAGMFLAFNSTIYKKIGGFNTKYHMYYEDVDICKRLNEAGHPVIWTPGIQVIHDAQRASSRSVRHLIWHLRSTARFLIGI